MRKIPILITSDKKYVKLECPVCEGHSLNASKGGEEFTCRKCGFVSTRSQLPIVDVDQLKK